jgi:hypothetical protein
MKWLIAILILEIVLIAGCTQSQGTQIFVSSINQTNENFGISLKNIHTDFYNYDINYNAKNIFNSYTIFESTITGMQNYEDKIKNELIYLQNLISSYQTMKGNANIEQLNQNQKNIDNDIESKITDFNANKDKINSCLDKMKTFREFVDLGRININTLEEYTTKYNLMTTKYQANDYNGTLELIAEIKPLLTELKLNGQERIGKGIINSTQGIIEAINAFDLFSNALDEFKSYIILLQKGDTINAQKQYDVYTTSYAKALDSSKGESLTSNLNEIDQWYQNNIAICLDTFKKYSS